MNKKTFITLFLCLWTTLGLWAETVTSTMPSNYYSAADGKTSDALRQALYNIIKGHTDIGYKNLATIMQYSDTEDADGTNIIDIYTNCTFTAPISSWSSSGTVGGGMNREHTVPQSWFSEATPMVSDAFHIYPTDCKANNNRSSYLYGEFSGAGTSYTSSSCSESGKLSSGNSNSIASYTYNGKTYSPSATHTGKVYEPADEYKGDIARGYFYMATRYATGSGTANCSNWSGGAFGSDNNGLATYTAELMLKWHRLDPVSKKELIRNEVIYGNTKYNKSSKKQGNRNPFIDYPCLVEYIWGDSVGKNVDFSQLISAYDASFSDQGCPCSNSTDPAITLPSSAVNVGSTEVGTPISKSVTIKGVNLTAGLSFEIGGTNASFFTLSTYSMTQANATAGTAITVTYTPTSGGSHSATLVIKNGGLSSNYTVDLSGTCCTPFVVNLSRNGILSSMNCCGTTTLPTATDEEDACSGWTFKGWITSSSYNSTTAPTYVTEVSSATTVYAVYGQTSGGGGSTNEELSCSAGTISNNQMSFSTTNFTIVHAQGTSNNFASYSPWRVYTDNTVTISGSKSITSVVITCSTEAYATAAANSTLTPTGGGTVSASASSTICTITATGTVTSLVIQPSAQTRWSSITINYGGGGTTTYKTTPCTTYTISYADTNGEAAHGSYWADQTSATEGTTIELDADPVDGYELTAWTVTKEGSSETVDVTNGLFTMPASNVTVAAVFSALTSHTVTFVNNGATYTTRSGYPGQNISDVVDPTACEGYTFEGWSASQYAVDNTGSPELVEISSMPSDDATYYAVYSKSEGGGTPELTNNYAKITSTDDLTSGNYLVVANNSETYNAMNTTWKATYYLEGATVTPSEDVITTTDASIIWTITVSDNKISFLNSESSEYLYIETSTSGTKTYYNVKLGNNTTDNKFTYSVTSGEWTFTSATYTNRVLEYHVANTRWAYYTSGDAPIYLYKQQSETGSITYHTTAPDCTPACNATITVQSLDDAQGTVSFE